MKYRHGHCLLSLLLLPFFSHAQLSPYSLAQNQLDSLHAVLAQTDNDSLKMSTANLLALHYIERNRDTTVYFCKQELKLAQKLRQPLWQMHALDGISYELLQNGNYPEALNAALDGLELARDVSSEKNAYRLDLLNSSADQDPHKVRISILSSLYQKMGLLHNQTANYDKAIENYRQAISLSESVDDGPGLYLAYLNLAITYNNKNELDSSLFSARKSLEYADMTGSKYWVGFIYSNTAEIYLKRNSVDSARHYIQLVIEISRNEQNLFSEAYAYWYLSRLFVITHQPDSVIFYANKAIKLFRPLNDQHLISQNYDALSTAYRYKNNTDSALFYLRLAKTLGDSVALAEKDQINRYLNLGFDEQFRLRNLQEERASYAAKIRTNTLLGSLLTLLVVAFFLYRNGRRKQRAKKEIERAYGQLKATQSQLIQSEKMASLGELTAGIAHEIQNPLNFVNNFSEVNKELLGELSEELNHGNIEEAKTITNNLKGNEEKIIHHGKRADGIVKGMLQHSKAASGQKEPTDINALCDEYLRLAYHGLRARDKSFNAELRTDFDDTLSADEAGIGKINVVPQDIGRVVLNLINNAFYAANEKLKAERLKQNTAGFQPQVFVRTRKLNGKVEITVRDNGYGVPDSIKEKIFQPFFTTKPTGQGTGLGLSLSYDIVKAHGGEIKADSKEGEGTTFIIQLPAT